jgi:NifU-like protein
MTFYPPKVNARFRSPLNAVKARDANAVGTSASFECGSFVRMSLEIEKETRVIREARFQTNGCGYMIAAAETVAEFLFGRKLTDLHGLGPDEYEELLSDKLEDFPQSRRQCADIVFNALKNSLADYREYVLEEFTGEKALICTCFGVSEETIEAYISANSPNDVSDVTEACRAGGGCGSCRMLIQEMIDSRDLS